MPTAGTEVAGAGRRDPRRAAARGHGRRRPTAPRRRGAAARCTTPELLDLLRTAVRRAGTAGRYRRAGRPGPGGALPLPDPGADRRACRRAAPRSRARRRRPVLLRHDDAGRPGHLGGGPRGGRLRADRGRPGGARASAAGVRAVPAARPPRDPGRVRRLLLPQQRRGRGRGAARRRARAGRRRRRRRPPRQRHRRRSSTSAPTCSTARCTSTPAPAGSRTSSGTPTRPAPGAGRARPATCRCPRAPATSRGWTAVAELADWVRRRGLHARWSSRSASTPPPTTRRARCRSPPTATARPAGCSAALGLPAVVVQEGGYHLPTLGGLVAAYLEGHAG